MGFLSAGRPHSGGLSEISAPNERLKHLHDERLAEVVMICNRRSLQRMYGKAILVFLWIRSVACVQIFRLTTTDAHITTLVDRYLRRMVLVSQGAHVTVSCTPCNLSLDISTLLRGKSQ